MSNIVGSGSADDLLAPSLRAWRRRLPVAALTWATALLVGVADVVETVRAPGCSAARPCRAQLGSAAYFLDAPTTFLAISVPILAFVWPRLALWTAVVIGLAFFVPSRGASDIPGMWLATASVLAALGVTDAAGRRRQRQVAARWPAVHQRPSIPAGTLTWSQDTRYVSAAAAAVLVAAAVGLTLVHGARLNDTRQFEAAAVRTTGVVTSSDPDGPLLIEVGGRRHTIDAIETYSLGSTVPVLVDPGSGRVALVAEPPDPSWLFGLAVLSVLMAGGILAAGWVRGGRRATLLREGGPGYRLQIGETSDGYLMVTDTADTQLEQPALFLGELTSLAQAVQDRTVAYVPRRRATEEELSSRSEFTDDEAIARVDELLRPRSDDDDGEEECEDDEHLDGGAEDSASEDLGVGDSSRQIVVIGRLVDGYPLLLATGSRLHLSSRSVRDPWLNGRLLTLILGRLPWAVRQVAPRVPARRPIRSGRWSRLSETWSKLVRRTGRTAAYALAVPLALLVWWILENPSATLTLVDVPFLLYLSVGCLVGLQFLASHARPILHRHPRGLRLDGYVSATVIPARAVTKVLAGRYGIVIRVHGPEDPLVIALTDLGEREGVRTPDEAAATVRGWLNSASAGTLAGDVLRSRKTLAPSVGPAALFLVALAVRTVMVLQP